MDGSSHGHPFRGQQRSCCNAFEYLSVLPVDHASVRSSNFPDANPSQPAEAASTAAGKAAFFIRSIEALHPESLVPVNRRVAKPRLRGTPLRRISVKAPGGIHASHVPIRHPLSRARNRLSSLLGDTGRWPAVRPRRESASHQQGDGPEEETNSVQKKSPAMTYFLSPQGTNIIGAEGLTAVFEMGTGVSLPL